MTDEYAVEVFLDPAAEAACDDVMAKLRDIGCPTIRSQGHRPHLSLTVGRNLQRLDQRALVVNGLPLEITLSAVATFPGSEGVVFWAVTPTKALLDLHSSWFDRLKRHSTWFDTETGRVVEHRSYYLPGTWVPHVSLGLNCPADLIGRSVEIVREYGPRTARLVDSALVHVPSGKVFAASE